MPLRPPLFILFPYTTLFRSRDLLTEEFIPYSSPSIVMSAFNDSDIGKLKVKIEEVLKQSWKQYEVYIPADQGDLLNRLKLQTVVDKQHFHEDDNSYHLYGYINPKHPIYNQLMK